MAAGAGHWVILAPLQPGGAPVTTTIRVKRGTHPAPWETLTARVVAGKESLSTQVRPVEGDPDSWDIDLIATAGSLSGVIPGRVEFVATAGGVPLPFSESLTVIARVQGTARADPSSLLFGTVPLGQRTAMDVDVLAEENQEKPQITGATVSDPERCSVVVGANGRITVTLTGKPSATKSPQASGHVDIHLARGTDLRVPYFAALAQP